jgi:lipooligosaccharide transport system permease protein
MLISAAVSIAERQANRMGSKHYAGRSHVILERSLVALKSSNWFPVVSGFLEPLLYLFSFGYGVGTLIGDIQVSNGQVVSYAMFIAPGLLATSAMNGAIYDSTWNVYFKLHEGKIYHGMLATSLGPLDVALGEILTALIRGFAYAVGFMAVATPMGLIPSWWGVLAIPAAVLIAFGFASIGMAITSYFKSYQQMGLINISLLPIFLFSGSFYPLSVFPDWAQIIIKTLPLWHAIELIRNLSLGIINFSLLGHIAYFLVMIVVGLFFTTRRLNALFTR